MHFRYGVSLCALQITRLHDGPVSFVRGPRVLPMLSRYRVSLRTERERSLATNEVVDPDAEPLDAM